MAARKRRSARERERLLNLHARTCHICKYPILKGEAWQLEHVIAWELTRDESDENVQPSHISCHKKKTVTDIRGIRKSDRQRQKHNGSWPKPIRKLQSRGFQRTRISP